ncbi:MAG: ribose 5-phosphate isomerase B [Oscillospiraceae bacterium]|nr:ribose 5-phosphate isomerase B [Oscillospiraceae bacterium]
MIVLAADHGGYTLKEEVKKHLDAKGVQYIDCGCYNGESVDYPDMAKQACEKIQSGEAEKGLLFCGSGVGISIAANKMKGIRCCCCSDTFSAKYTRLHNDANVLAMGGRIVGPGLAIEMIELFLNTEFEGGRHSRRVEKLMALED